MIKVKVLEKKARDQWVKVMVSNERPCQKEYTSNSKIKDQMLKVMISKERSYQKEYTCKIWKP
jgi:hypothetical protein